MSTGSSDPPVRLKRLEIRDLRGIDHLELDFPEPDDDGGSVVVLAGENGCGKTTVLEAVLLVLGRIDLLPEDTAPPEALVRLGAQDYSIRSAITSLGKISEYTVSGNFLAHVFQLLADNGRRIGFGRRSDISSSARFLRTVAGERCRVESISARREPAGLGVTDAAPAVRDERRLAELAKRLANVFARSGRDATFGRIERFARPFFGERWSLDVIFSDDSIGSDPVVVLRDGELPQGTNGELRTMSAIRAWAASGKPCPKVIPIDRMSSGQMALLAMTYPFVFGDRPVDIALIDEPEQHLHPAWQRAFLGAMRALSPSTQFIVATHSPQVLDSVARDERRALVRDDSQGTVPDAAQ